MANGYSATPGIVAGALTVNGPITSLSDAGIRIGAAAPFVRLFKDPVPGLGASYNLGSDAATRDNTGLGATELVATDTLNAPSVRILNSAGTAFFRALDTTLAQDGTSVNNTGSITENTVKSKVIAANTLGSNGALIVEVILTSSSQSVTPTAFRLRMGGTQLAIVTTATATGTVLRAVVAAGNATNVQNTYMSMLQNNLAPPGSNTTTALDATVDQTLALSIQNGTATDNWTVVGWRVRAFGGRSSGL